MVYGLRLLVSDVGVLAPLVCVLLRIWICEWFEYRLVTIWLLGYEMRIMVLLCRFWNNDIGLWLLFVVVQV